MKFLSLVLGCWLFTPPLMAQETPESPAEARVIKDAGSERPAASAPQPWNVVGVWDCTHPGWTDQITLAADGTLSRRHDDDAGRWTLTNLDGKILLVLVWNGWSSETVTLIGPDEFRGKVHTQVHDGEFVLRRASSPKTSGDSVKVLAASYSFGSQYADVTGRVKELLHAGEPFQANPEYLLVDPQPGWNKCLVIVCEVRGKRAIFSVGEGDPVSHDLLLNNSRPVNEARTTSQP